MKKDTLYNDALAYHREPNGPGKISITPTKALMTQRDLALAYSPGVAAPCEEIVADPSTASLYTARGNLVAVITNGTAVLGLGNIGPLAAKPVMEGKSVLFKKFSGIDAIDIEIDETNVDKLVDIIASLEPSFGAINLEDIKSPECFEVERRLKERMKIPVFHDDQHGTAIIVATAFLNWLTWSGRDIKVVKIVTAGAGAAAMACVSLLVEMGVPKKNILLTDLHGVVHKGRNEEMDEVKKPFAQETKFRTLKEAIKGADVFLGLSAPRVLTPAMLKSMGKAPLIMALANPTPEIMPEEAHAARPDAIICTGRSDYPNQVNNALCFPFIFRGALDVGATGINEKMKIACVKALSKLTMAEATAEVAAVYGDVPLQFGPEDLIPKPFDPRLIMELPPAVAKAAMDSGVATRPITDFTAYRARLEKYVYKSGQLMRPIYARAAANMKRVAFAEGEEMRVLHAAQVLVEDRAARPLLVGREEVIMARIQKLGLHMKKGRDFEIVNPEDDPRFNDYWRTYHKLMERKGITPPAARTLVRTRNSLIAALLLRKNDADAVICGTIGRFNAHYQHISDVIGLAEGVRAHASLSIMILPKGTFFICDAFVNTNPTTEDLCDMTLLAVEEIRKFGMEPRIALLSHSDFGSINCPEAVKMREATQMIKDRAPELSVEGEMTGSAALSEEIREKLFPNSELKGQANLLVMPNIDAANIAFHLLKVLGDGIVVGPLLLGTPKPAHVLIPSVTSRGIANAAAYACASAGETPPSPLRVLRKARRKSDRPDKKRTTKRKKQAPERN